MKTILLPSRNVLAPLAGILAACQILAGAALAHVTVSAPDARAGEQVEVTLAFGHGCQGVATTALRVAIPEGVSDIRPGAKDGWQVDIGEREFGWSGGNVPDHQHEQFTFTATLAQDAPGQLPFPVVQVCGDRQTRWIDSDQGSNTPAPLIEVLPAQ